MEDSSSSYSSDYSSDSSYSEEDSEVIEDNKFQEEVEDHNDESENQNQQKNPSQNIFQIENANSNLLSGIISIPPLIQSQSIQHSNFGLNLGNSFNLPPLPSIDFLEIHQDLKTQYIDPFDINPKNKQKVQHKPVSTNDSMKSVEIFDWHTFQLPDVPEVDDTEILDSIHKRFDMQLLVELMRKG